MIRTPSPKRASRRLAVTLLLATCTLAAAVDARAMTPGIAGAVHATARRPPAPARFDPLDPGHAGMTVDRASLGWFPPRAEPRATPPPRSMEPVTGGQALGISLVSTAVPTAVGAWLVSQPPNSLIDLRQALGAVLFGVGVTMGPSTGYFAGGLERRGDATALARVAALAVALREDDRAEARAQRAAGWTAITALALWDFAHVAGDVDAGGVGVRLGLVQGPEGGPAMAVRSSF